MLLAIGDVLTGDVLAAAKDVAPKLRYDDGRATAGWSAKLVKKNEQARAGAALDELRGRISQAILGHALFELAVRPKAITPLIISKTDGGGHYGRHVDNPIMGGLRTDVSFTLFLADPESYEGGELVIESTAGEESFKLPAGSLVAYPSTTLHRVEPVTKGTRYVAVGWAQSLVRDASQRELLFELDTARRRLFDQVGKTEEVDLLSKCSANLLRMWAEV